MGWEIERELEREEERERGREREREGEREREVGGGGAYTHIYMLERERERERERESPSVDPRTPGAWQGSHWSANFLSHWYDTTPEKFRRKLDSNPGSSAHEADALTTRPPRRS